MNRDDVIRMAREAGISIRVHYDETGPTPQELLRFAASVIKSLKPSLQTEFEKMFMEGAAAEREAIKQVAEREMGNTSMLLSMPPKSSAAWNILQAINARGQA